MADNKTTPDTLGALQELQGTMNSLTSGLAEAALPPVAPGVDPSLRALAGKKDVQFTGVPSEALPPSQVVTDTAERVQRNKDDAKKFSTVDLLEKAALAPVELIGGLASAVVPDAITYQVGEAVKASGPIPDSVREAVNFHQKTLDYKQELDQEFVDNLRTDKGINDATLELQRMGIQNPSLAQVKYLIDSTNKEQYFARVGMVGEKHRLANTFVPGQGALEVANVVEQFAVFGKSAAAVGKLTGAAFKPGIGKIATAAAGGYVADYAVGDRLNAVMNAANLQDLTHEQEMMNTTGALFGVAVGAGAEIASTVLKRRAAAKAGTPVAAPVVDTANFTPTDKILYDLGKVLNDTPRGELPDQAVIDSFMEQAKANPDLGNIHFDKLSLKAREHFDNVNQEAKAAADNAEPAPGTRVDDQGNTHLAEQGDEVYPEGSNMTHETAKVYNPDIEVPNKRAITRGSEPSIPTSKKSPYDNSTLGVKINKYKSAEALAEAGAKADTPEAIIQHELDKAYHTDPRAFEGKARASNVRKALDKSKAMVEKTYGVKVKDAKDILTAVFSNEVVKYAKENNVDLLTASKKAAPDQYAERYASTLGQAYVNVPYKGKSALNFESHLDRLLWEVANGRTLEARNAALDALREHSLFKGASNKFITNTAELMTNGPVKDYITSAKSASDRGLRGPKEAITLPEFASNNSFAKVKAAKEEYLKSIKEKLADREGKTLEPGSKAREEVRKESIDVASKDRDLADSATNNEDVIAIGKDEDGKNTSVVDLETADTAKVEAALKEADQAAVKAHAEGFSIEIGGFNDPLVAIDFVTKHGIALGLPITAVTAYYLLNQDEDGTNSAGQVLAAAAMVGIPGGARRAAKAHGNTQAVKTLIKTADELAREQRLKERTGTGKTKGGVRVDTAANVISNATKDGGARAATDTTARNLDKKIREFNAALEQRVRNGELTSEQAQHIAADLASAKLEFVQSGRVSTKTAQGAAMSEGRQFIYEATKDAPPRELTTEEAAGLSGIYKRPDGTSPVDAQNRLEINGQAGISVWTNGKFRIPYTNIEINLGKYHTAIFGNIADKLGLSKSNSVRYLADMFSGSQVVKTADGTRTGRVIEQDFTVDTALAAINQVTTSQLHDVFEPAFEAWMTQKGITGAKRFDIGRKLRKEFMTEVYNHIIGLEQGSQLIVDVANKRLAILEEHHNRTAALAKKAGVMITSDKELLKKASQFNKAASVTIDKNWVRTKWDKSAVSNLIARHGYEQVFKIIAKAASEAHGPNKKGQLRELLREGDKLWHPSLADQGITRLGATTAEALLKSITTAAKEGKEIDYAKLRDTAIATGLSDAQAADLAVAMDQSSKGIFNGKTPINMLSDEHVMPDYVDDAGNVVKGETLSIRDLVDKDVAGLTTEYLHNLNSSTLLGYYSIKKLGIDITHDARWEELKHTMAAEGASGSEIDQISALKDKLQTNGGDTYFRKDDVSGLRVLQNLTTGRHMSGFIYQGISEMVSAMTNEQARKFMQSMPGMDLINGAWRSDKFKLTNPEDRAFANFIGVLSSDSAKLLNQYAENGVQVANFSDRYVDAVAKYSGVKAAHDVTTFMMSNAFMKKMILDVMTPDIKFDATDMKIYRAIGYTEEVQKTLRDNLGQYVKMSQDGIIESVDYARMQAENPEMAIKIQEILHRQAARINGEVAGVGQSRPWMTRADAKIFTKFMSAMLNSHDRLRGEAAIFNKRLASAWAFNFMIATMTYTVRTRIALIGYSQEEIDRRMDPKALLLGGAGMMSTLGALPTLASLSTVFMPAGLLKDVFGDTINNPSRVGGITPAPIQLLNAGGQSFKDVVSAMWPGGDPLTAGKVNYFATNFAPNMMVQAVIKSLNPQSTPTQNSLASHYANINKP